ncbi:MAG: hypothetical protein GY758_14210 [Fuerstiella sp.]|nr:hypothetical protein [Fuerstiella sp.]
MAEVDSTIQGNTAGTSTSSEKLPLPPWKTAIGPAYLFRLIEYWIFSRVPSRILWGLPSAIVAFGGMLFLLYLKHDDQQAAVQRYEEAVSEAIQEEDWESASLFLNSLCSLRPHLQHYKFQLALLYHQAGNEPAAFGLMQQLAPLNGAEGFAPARTWLVKHATSGNELGLKKEFVGQQLIAAVRERPFDPEANQMLANYYVSERQYRLAETHLKRAAEYAPETYLSLAQLQKQHLKRGPEVIRSSLEFAKDAFQQQLTEDTGNLNARIQWSRCHAIEGQFDEAVLILQEGLSLQDAPELRTALSQLYAEIANTRLQESRLNAALAGRLLIQSLAITPTNVAAIAQLSSLPATELTISESDLKNAITYWQQQVQAEDAPAARLVLAQLLKMCGRTTEAIPLLETGLADHPETRPLLAQLYAIENRTEESNRLYNQLLQDVDDGDDQSPTQTITARALLLLQALRLDEALAFIRDRRQDVPDAEQGPLNRIHAKVLITMVDQLLGAPTDESEAAFNLLKESVSVAPQEQSALIRLASISCSTLSAAADADSLLTEILADGSSNASVYTYIGTEALRGNQFQKARRNLETARRLDPQNPMVLNNLALAASRGPSPDYDYALSLVASVLELLPDHPDALSTRAEILLAMERWEEADRDLQLALPDRPSSQNVRRLLVLVNEKLGNQALADRHRDILAQMQDKGE